ncbi:Uncharacterised protein [Serratia grimesii]|nr:Uncharacterised protein [Serratia grimesii]
MPRCNAAAWQWVMLPGVNPLMAMMPLTKSKTDLKYSLLWLIRQSVNAFASLSASGQSGYLPT